jgi:hypothetical protein
LASSAVSGIFVKNATRKKKNWKEKFGESVVTCDLRMAQAMDDAVPLARVRPALPPGLVSLLLSRGLRTRRAVALLAPEDIAATAGVPLAVASEVRAACLASALGRCVPAGRVPTVADLAVGAARWVLDFFLATFVCVRIHGSCERIHGSKTIQGSVHLRWKAKKKKKKKKKKKNF